MTDTTFPLESARERWSANTWLAMLSMLATSFALVSAEFLACGPADADGERPWHQRRHCRPGRHRHGVGRRRGCPLQQCPDWAVEPQAGDDRAQRFLPSCSNLLAAFATDFWLLLLGRAGLGIALSAFWALSVAVVARIVGEGAIGRGMAMVGLGVSLATIAAPSLGALISDWLGWRSAMALTASLSGLALLLQLLGLPTLPASTGNSLGDVFRLLRRPGHTIGHAGHHPADGRAYDRFGLCAPVP
jgi:DHA1 family purine ribonucleoside efflux pump-like MFS transporter